VHVNVGRVNVLHFEYGFCFAESIEDHQNCIIDIDGLAKKLADSILAREYLETRHNTVEDDGLVGLLNLMSNVMKHNPPFKTSKEGQDFLSQVCYFLLLCIHKELFHFL